MKERGFITILVLVVIGLILLKYFLNWDIFDAASSDQGQSTMGYIRNIFNLVWSYIAAPVIFVWERILWPIIDLSWRNFQNFIAWGRGNYDSFF